MAFDPIRKFLSIAVSDIVEAFNTLVNEINERLAIAGQDSAQVAVDLAAHEADQNNPHATTAAQTGAYTQAQVNTLIAGAAFPVVSYALLSTLTADLTHAAGTLGQVYNDGANNGSYTKLGASGAGSWSFFSSATIPSLAAQVAVLNSGASVARQTLSEINATIRKEGGTLKAAWFASLGVTEYAPGIIGTWLDQSGNAISAGPHTTIFSGANPRPVVINDKEVSFNSEAGLTVANGILSKTDNFLIHYPFKIGVTAGKTYADQASMTAGAAGATQGDIAQITGGPKTTFTPDTDYVFQNGYTDAQLIRGFYARGNTAAWGALTCLWSFNSPSGYYIRLYLTRLGQFYLYYNAPGGGGAIYPISTSVIDGVEHLFSVLRETTCVRLFFDGQEVGTPLIIGSSISITDLNTLYMNNFVRTASTGLPVNGVRHTQGGMIVIDDPSWRTFKDTYNSLARFYGTPLYNPPSIVYCGVIVGASLANGTRDNTDAWVDTDGWNGMLNPTSANGGELGAMDRDLLPGVYSHAWYGAVITNSQIGPHCVTQAANGAVGGGYTPSLGRETYVPGLMKWLLSHPKAPKAVQYCFTHVEGYNGFPPNNPVTSRSTPPYLAQAVKGQATGALTQYERILQSLVEMRDFFVGRDQRPVFKLVLAVWGGAHPIGTDEVAFYDQLNADGKQIFGHAEDVIFIGRGSDGGSSDGSTNVTNFHSQRALDGQDLRGTRPMYLANPMWDKSMHTHPYPQLYRWMGEDFGRVGALVMFDGADYQPVRPRSFTIAGNTIKIWYWLGRGTKLQWGTNNHLIPGMVQTGGINTYGFDYVGGGLTIVSVALSTTATTDDSVTVTFSGPPGLPGHALSFLKASVKGNLFNDDVAVAYTKDQAWPATIVSGKANWALGSTFDMRSPGYAFSKTF